MNAEGSAPNAEWTVGGDSSRRRSVATTIEILPLTETVTPADEAAVAGVVREAYGPETPVYPIGGGTRLDYGLRPTRPGIGLSLAQLNRVVDYPADDMTITVQAGLTIAELAAGLAEKHQRLPVDIPQADRATVGGAVATGLSGPRRYAHGTIRDYVIGIRAVDGLGTAFSGGGRVVKNAAGYNLCRLMVGSLGTLGVITQVTLMVRPLPETSALVVCELPELDAAEGLLAGLVHTQTLPAAIELLAGPASQENLPMGPMLQSSVARLIVGFGGSQPAVDWMVRRLQDEWREQGVSPLTTLGDSEAGPMWDWLTEFPADLQIAVPPAATAQTVGRLLRLNPDGAIQAHAGNGVIRVRLSPPMLDRFGELVRSRLRPAVTGTGGKMVVLCCPEGEQLSRQDVWGPSGDGAVAMQAIKDRFDPKGLLNPGRFAYAD
jgi:glycolate oxidase FAD binding subunit